MTPNTIATPRLRDCSSNDEPPFERFEGARKPERRSAACLAPACLGIKLLTVSRDPKHRAISMSAETPHGEKNRAARRTCVEGLVRDLRAGAFSPVAAPATERLSIRARYSKHQSDHQGEATTTSRIRPDGRYAHPRDFGSDGEAQDRAQREEQQSAGDHRGVTPAVA